MGSQYSAASPHNTGQGHWSTFALAVLLPHPCVETTWAHPTVASRSTCAAPADTKQTTVWEASNRSYQATEEKQPVKGNCGVQSQSFSQYHVGESDLKVHTRAQLMLVTECTRNACREDKTAHVSTPPDLLLLHSFANFKKNATSAWHTSSRLSAYVAQNTECKVNKCQ